MPTLHQQPLRPQRLGEPLLDLFRLRQFQPLQVQHRPRQHLEPPLQHTARRADPGLVLLDKNRGNNC